MADTWEAGSDGAAGPDPGTSQDRSEGRKGQPGSRATQILAVAAVVLASLPVVALGARHHPVLIAPFILTLLGLTATAARTCSGAVLRVVLAADVVLLAVLAAGIRIWPAPLVLAPLLVWVVSFRLPSLRPALGWLRKGKLTGEVPYLMLATIAVSAAALTAWALIVHPPVGAYLGSLQKRPRLIAITGVVAFALVNAACEESAYRGIFFGNLQEVAGNPVALVVQAVCFGLIHISGFPSGPAGIVLAAIYGLMLGVIRLRSRGMLAPYVAHVLADTTIGLLAVFVL